MAGHNKWTQIKHQKATEDAKKSKLFSALAQAITVEAQLAHGDIGVPGLRQAIEKARVANMPAENIERAIERALTAGGAGEEVLYEAYGPSGVALLIKGLTPNKNRTNQEIKHLLAKHEINLSAPGSVTWSFHKMPDGKFQAKHQVTLSQEDNEKLRRLVEELKAHTDITEIFTNSVDL
jgi:YebC/PmpR family DNA-binding regulatory protein